MVLRLKRDLTNQYMENLIEVLKDLKGRNMIDKNLFKKLYPTTDQQPRFYDLPKVHKTNMPLHLIVSSIGTFMIV